MKLPIIAALSIIVAASGCTSANNSVNSPSDTAKTYFGELTGDNPDYKKAYNLVSEDYRNNHTYDNWYVQVQNSKTGFNRNGVSIEVLDYETISISNQSARVKLDIRVTQRGRVTPKDSVNITLVKENENWKLSKAVNPYSGESGFH